MLLPILENSTPTGSTGHTTAHYFLLTSHALRYRKRQRPAADLGRVRRSRRRLGGETRLCRPRRTSPTREPEAPEIQHGPPGHGDQPGRRLGRGHRASHGTLLLSLRVTARSQAPAGEADPGGTPGSGNWVTTGCPPVAPAPRGSVGEIPRVAVCPSRWAAAFLTSTTSLAGGKREKPAAERALRAVKTWALHSLPALKHPSAELQQRKQSRVPTAAERGLVCCAGPGAEQAAPPARSQPHAAAPRGPDPSHTVHQHPKRRLCFRSRSRSQNAYRSRPPAEPGPSAPSFRVQALRSTTANRRKASGEPAAAHQSQRRFKTLRLPSCHAHQFARQLRENDEVRGATGQAFTLPASTTSPGHAPASELLAPAPRRCLHPSRSYALLPRTPLWNVPDFTKTHTLRKRLLKGERAHFSLSSVCFPQRPGSHLKQGQRSALKEPVHSTCGFGTGGESLLAPLRL